MHPFTSAVTFVGVQSDPVAAVTEPSTSSLVDEILRGRLVARLASRWAVPVVLVEGPAGYGKTIALRQAVQANLHQVSGTDVVHSCRPPDRDASNLGGALLRLLGSTKNPSGPEPDDLAGMIVTRMADLAPASVCVILDDVHHLDDADSSVAMLQTLIRSLPVNAHLVLAGRSMPALPLARLMAADQLVRVDEDELVFTTQELMAFAQQHGVAPERLERTAGWPALARLALVVGEAAPIEYLIEEVLHGLDEPIRRALAAAVLGRVVDDEALEAIVGGPVTTTDLLGSVPLLTPMADDALRAHDFWVELLDHIVDEPTLRSIGTRASQWHLRHGRHEEALEAAVAVGAWELARAAVLDALAQGDAELRVSRTERWLAMFPPEQSDEPELRLLRGISLRMAGHLDDAQADVEAALAGLVDHGTPRQQATAALEVGWAAWLAGDVGRVLEMVEFGERLHAAGVDGMGWMVDLARGGFADLQGDFAAAVASMERIDEDSCASSAAQLVLRWRSTLCMLIGDSVGAMENAMKLLEIDPSDKAYAHAATTAWQHGDPAMVFAGPGGRVPVTHFDNALYDLFARSFGAVVGASLGEVAELADLVRIDAHRGRERAYLVVAEAAARVAGDDEQTASSVVEQLVDEGGLDDALVRGELRRFVAICAPLSRRVADAVRLDDLGPQQRRRLALAELFVASRSGAAEWDMLPDPREVLTAFPLPWTMELAARAASDGHPAGTSLSSYAMDVVGAPAQDLLRRWRGTPGAVGTGADRLLAELPSLPSATVRIVTCGPLRVEGAGPADELRRARVRELLGLVVLRGRVSGELVGELLWPDLDRVKRQNNLRLTLNYLRNVLEPDRERGQPFHVRRIDDVISMERSGFLDVDLWRMSEAIERGRAHETTGRIGDAMREYRSAVELWTGELLVDLRLHDELAPELTHLDMLLGSTTARLAEFCLSQGDDAAAESWARQLLDRDPYAERAHAVVISARLGRGDQSGAADAAAACRDALAQLAVDPSSATAVLLRRAEQAGAA
jgi:LuxR family transcriptional regulator, maltose regulon positive regulatory protein